MRSLMNSLIFARLNRMPMNKLFLAGIHRIIVLNALLLTILACQTNDTNTATPKTIADRVLEDSQFSLLRTAVTYAGVGDALKDANLTLFAPTDAAFQASGLTESAIRSLPKEQVKDIVLYHVLYSPVSSTAIPSGQNSVQTATNGVAFVNKINAGTVYVNQARVTETDLATANGFIHVIDRVLMPSAGNMLAAIQGNPNLTFLAAAVRRVGSSSPTLLAALSSSSTSNPVTVFAPSDAAFKSDGRYNSLAAIESANPQTLASLLSYHVVSGVLFSNQLQSGSVNTLLNGNRVTIASVNGTATVKGAKNSTPAALKTTDLVAANGVIHIIDQVLQP
ncbi:hypothetical protein GCM10027577_07610 [Spirosoma fluminis]